MRKHTIVVTPKNYEVVIDSLLQDPEASSWLKQVLVTALLEEPIDAANDAEILSAILNARAKALLDEVDEAMLDDAIKPT